MEQLRLLLQMAQSKIHMRTVSLLVDHLQDVVLSLVVEKYPWVLVVTKVEVYES
jgi:hypothetical protein